MFATCDALKGLCYVKNDAPTAFVGTLVVNTTSLATGETTTIASQNVSLPRGAGAIEWVTFPALAQLDAKANVLEAIVTTRDAAAAAANQRDDHDDSSNGGLGTTGSSSDNSGVVAKNLVMLSTPGDMLLLPAHVSVTAVKSDDGRFYANVTCDAAAIFVTLTTLAHGRFDDNAFFSPPPGRLVAFKVSTLAPYASEDEAWLAFSRSLRVEDASAYME